MRKLSLWAKHYPVYARIVIVISHCILIWIGYFLGMQLTQSGIELSSLWIYFLMIVFFVTAFVYPSNHARKNYIKRKLCDFIITFCSFFLTICLVNELNKPFTMYQTAQATSRIVPSPYKYGEAKTLLEQFQNGEKTKFTPKERRIIKKEFKYQLGQYAKAKITGNKDAQGQAAAILLVCIAAVGLFILVSALACNIACNGSEVAAWIVFLLGTAAIVLGAVAIIRNIKRKHGTLKSKSS